MSKLFYLKQSVTTHACGIFLGLFFLSGRWDFGRIYAIQDPYYEMLLRPSYWMAVLFVFFSMLINLNKPNSPYINQRSISTRNLTVILIFLFFVYMGFSSLWAPNPQLALVKLSEIMVVFIVLIGLSFFLFNSNRHALLDSFWPTILVVTSILLMLSDFSSYANRLTSLGGGPNVLGRNAGLAAISCLILASRYYRPMLFISLCPLFGILCLATGSRGAMIALATAIAYLLIVKKISIFAKIAIISSSISISLLILHTSVGTYVSEVFYHRFLDMLFLQKYYSERPLLFQIAFEIGMSNFFIGTGLNGFAAMGISSYPHNLFLEVFSEGGIIGIVLLSVALFSFLYFCKCNMSIIHHESIAAWILLMVSSQFSGDLFDSRGVFIVLILILFVPINRFKSHFNK